MTFIINPLNQLIVWKDPTYKEGKFVLDQLTEHWNHKKQIETSPYDTAEQSFAYFANEQPKIGRKKFPEGGWVKIKLDKLEKFSDLSKPAMDKLGKGELYYGM